MAQGALKLKSKKPARLTKKQQNPKKAAPKIYKPKKNQSTITTSSLNKFHSSSLISNTEKLIATSNKKMNDKIDNDILKNFPINNNFNVIAKNINTNAIKGPQDEIQVKTDYTHSKEIIVLPELKALDPKEEDYTTWKHSN
ncbi:hypothetical protein PACTADRAFT_17703 [Pachysolen tannophilus NRRL Y-2460]|uniref:Uncharacterized protein n=1 Tax=Pachysolen tannophilus NRRL Y-2460 TaxID=669874 RepID=A0A1E4TTI6_PACTA|nr:hypothetical protein PACTADRAFT_17703 [Pachysolen tannophilus NRRL Y-2460]